MKEIKGLAAALAFTLTCSFMAGCIFWIIFGDYPATAPDYLQSVLFFGMFFTWGSAILVIPIVLILLIPLHRFAIKLARVAVWDYAINGGLFGLFVCLAIQGLSRMKLFLEFPGQVANFALIIAPLLGASSALGLWLVTRPDKGSRGLPSSA